MHSLKNMILASIVSVSSVLSMRVCKMALGRCTDTMTDLCLNYYIIISTAKFVGLKLILFNVFSGLTNGRIPALVPAAHMSTGPAGGGGGENRLYFALVGAAFVATGIYVSINLAYYTLTIISDQFEINVYGVKSITFGRFGLIHDLVENKC